MAESIVTDSFMEDWPWRTGVFYARFNEECDPESIYQEADCIVHFIMGYVSVKGSSERTVALLQKYEPALLQSEEIIMAQSEEIGGD